MILQFPQKMSGNRSGLVKAGREIEIESFRIIDEEMGEHSFSSDEWQVVRRVIHTTGDFDYAQRIRFTSDAITSGVKAIREGACIYADTRMVRVGLAPWRLQWHCNNVICPSENPENQEAAEASGVTRTSAAFRGCSGQLAGSIIAIGNAPTALHETVRMIEEEGIRPALVIGVPVGFVQAEESKSLLWQAEEQPCITVLGRKGGSSVAVAIVHALLELAKTG